MENLKLINLNKQPELIAIAAKWFHQKWQVPEQAYLDSMMIACNAANGVPQWYVITNQQAEIIAGIGVIDNDFHPHPNLTPNICALYVEPSYRHQGIAQKLLNAACSDLAEKGINKVYLITDLLNFYEQYGWTFFDMITDDDDNQVRMYQRIISNKPI